MTEDQKAISLILDLLKASKGVPRTLPWIESEMRYAGRRGDLPALMEMLVEGKLVATHRDGLKIRRYEITPAGKEALDAL
jgi:predicted transcriptional regulator